MKTQKITNALFTLTDAQIVVARRPETADDTTAASNFLAVHTHIKAGPFVYYEGKDVNPDDDDSGTWDTD